MSNPTDPACALRAQEPEWLTEWAIEVTWVDPVKAGAKGPTSQYGPFDNPEQRDSFLTQCRRNDDMAATRVLTRRAAYTSWEGEEPVPTTKEERDALKEALWRSINPH